MRLIDNLARIVLIVLTGFLALAAIGGGISLLAGWGAPPTSMLDGSPFSTFTLPGLALLLIVGGTALTAMILLIRRSAFGLFSAITAGVILMFFEFIEILVIGSPVGAARDMQIFCFALGTLIVVISMGSWLLDLLSSAPSSAKMTPALAH